MTKNEVIALIKARKDGNEYRVISRIVGKQPNGVSIREIQPVVSTSWYRQPGDILLEYYVYSGPLRVKP